MLVGFAAKQGGEVSHWLDGYSICLSVTELGVLYKRVGYRLVGYAPKEQYEAGPRHVLGIVMYL